MHIGDRRISKLFTRLFGRTFLRFGLAASVVALASACTASTGLLTGEPPNALLTAPPSPITPLNVLTDLETGGINSGQPGRAARDIERALAALPAEDGLLLDGASIGASPRPWLDFCRDDPKRTRCASEPVVAELTSARLHQLMAAQEMVHQNTRQRPDEAFLGDRWELIGHNQAGDCEDMALTKRDILMTWGWPAGALRPAICTISGVDDGVAGDQLHAVLTVDTDGGTYVLGNLREGVRSIENSECEQWVMRSDGIQWSWIDGGATIALQPVSAVK